MSGALAQAMDNIVDVSSLHLCGTRTIRVQADEEATERAFAVPDSAAAAAAAAHAEPRLEQPLSDEELQLRGLRRAVVERVHLGVRQIRDAKAAGAPASPFAPLLRRVEGTSVEALWNPADPVARDLLKLDVRARATPKAKKEREGEEAGRVEEVGLLLEMQHHLRTAHEMTAILAKADKSGIRKEGGVRELFPDLQKDFTDVTAPHVDSYNRAINEGLDELLAEMRGGLDAEAVQALPRYYILSISDRKRAGPSLKLKQPSVAVATAVENALRSPPSAMCVKYSVAAPTAGKSTDLTYVLSLERERRAPGGRGGGDADDDAEEEEESFMKLDRKKRMAKLLAQKPVDEREAGGARRLLRHLREVTDALGSKDRCIEVDLRKVYVRAEVSKVVCGWTGKPQDVEGSDAVHRSPIGRATLHRVFQAWANDFISLSHPSDRDVRRAMLQPYREWLEKRCNPEEDDTPPGPSPPPPAAASADEGGRKKGKKHADGTGAPPPAAKRLRRVAGQSGLHGGYDDAAPSSASAAVASQRWSGAAPRDASLGTKAGAAPRSGGTAAEGKAKRLRDFNGVVTLMRSALEEGPEGDEEAAAAGSSGAFGEDEGGFGRREKIRDPGLPEGGVAALQEMYAIFTETPGSPLHPQGRRMHKSNYTAPLLVRVTYSFSAGSGVGVVPLFSASDWVFAGHVPVMVRSNACMLDNRTPGELANVFYEEGREPGGYFIMSGNERVLRMVLVARGNHPITIERASFSNKGPSFTSKCVYVRSVKRSGVAVPNYLYMLLSGKIILSFSRGSTWQVPLSLVMLALADTLTPLELAEKMTSVGDDDTNKWVSAFMGDVFNQVQLARHYAGLDQEQKASGGFPSCSKHWQYVLGRYLCTHKKVWVREVVARCRARLGAGCFDSEVYSLVGLWAIREHVLPHLNDYSSSFDLCAGERKAKLEALIVMVKKLVKFQSGRLREEGEDCLLNQEIITPGQLWLHTVMDAVTSVARGLRSSLSMLGLTDNRAREGWTDLRPPTIDDFLELCCGGGEHRLRDVIWNYFWQKRTVGGRPQRRGKHKDMDADAILAAAAAAGVDGLFDLAGTVSKKLDKPETYFKMRFEKAADEDDDKKGNRQRVLTEPTYPACFMASTGNYTQEPLLANGTSLPQNAGWSVVVERINQFRFLEQFRATHRGKTIQEMRTTTPRRYQMDGWGFLCIVHTPDGGPCGVMNHLSYPTQVVCGLSTQARLETRARVLEVLEEECGATAFASIADEAACAKAAGTEDWYPVSVDSEVVGYVHEYALRASKLAHHVEARRSNASSALRKARAENRIRNDVEIVSVDPRWMASAVGLTGVTKDVGDVTCKAPKLDGGIYIFTGPGRLSRPVKKLGTSQYEKGSVYWVGTQEQIFLDIAALHKDVGDARVEALKGNFDFIEMNTTSALSLTASLIPYFEMNCSPRNLFQCGMAKQTMGSCFHSVTRRNDNKLYFTHACQAALLRTENQHVYRMDDYPNGVNVVLAVAAYTGFDMEDALLINKTSVERGLFQGSIYLGTILDPSSSPSGVSTAHYTTIPHEGQFLKKGDVYATTSDGGRETWSKAEAGRVHSVEILQTDVEEANPTRVRVIFRIQRTPVIGDKFAARHGQKGTLPILIPQVCYFFSLCLLFVYARRAHTSHHTTPHHTTPRHATSHHIPTARDAVCRRRCRPRRDHQPPRFPVANDSGHAYRDDRREVRGRQGHVPRRHSVERGMTLTYFLCSSFCFIRSSFFRIPTHSYHTHTQISDKPIHSEKMGDMLGGLGYSHTGASMLTHGATGEQMQCDIYTGICYYQRLRHMVDDKYQARERADRGAGVDPLTGQPVKGRKRGGGIRVGEMERDALIAHGTLQVGRDRLLKSSDLGVVQTCAACGSTPCTCKGKGEKQYRFAPKAMEFMNTQLRAMGVAVRTVASKSNGQSHLEEDIAGDESEFTQ